MPPKKGAKRKAKAISGNSTANGDASLAPPDRSTWPGWVEMESEPAFFNVMIREMGVQGVKVQEIYELDENMLAFLSEPVHAFIFLFRYKDADAQSQSNGSCPKHVWFANQTPDYACASFALLNIVNNIPGLRLGKELQDFKDFTQDMDPLSRGNAVDDFAFVKRIHNSFARETDLLHADMQLWSKADKHKRRLAAEKAKETRAAKKALKTSPPAETPEKANGVTPNGKSTRTPKPTAKKSAMSNLREEDPDGDFQSSASPLKNGEGHDNEGTAPRRSAREPKPRKDTYAADGNATDEATATEEEGFHFIAYMPIQGHVWKLDGLDRHPQDLGSFGENEADNDDNSSSKEGGGGDWKKLVIPELTARMAQCETGIQFNLMAVLHDPLHSEREALAQNAETLQLIDTALDGLAEGWREMDGGETPSDIVTTAAAELGISAFDIEHAEIPGDVQKTLDEYGGDFLQLLGLRAEIVAQQRPLRLAVRDAMTAVRGDDEKARHRRHDYTSFLRGWLGALAEEEVLADLVAAA
ncbi:hypothetical protein KC332_g14173 [Hortaea werneckii]|uniref:ubiquitinyl hydrolase 1 n=2 Tax=Hortaea werneckii TaxID=91943 RepID=A0A3M7I6R4_HORWE|nr:hypothetical protein KC350_g12627 [Hortaea werneckii]OTA21485.1 hypothetical protein BTJ68_15235 [Hortaea werneckii EXF-2000]KAI6818368.1 hypothetical protein KC358_g10054 [Hortaea werneckii]KAI6911002.1 hypothetical protein KC348_g13050 [Hortaea werneckii]KAI6926618.1 hypothetical protein KC341_g12670 [Hortaea werneckii]